MLVNVNKWFFIGFFGILQDLWLSGGLYEPEARIREELGFMWFDRFGPHERRVISWHLATCIDLKSRHCKDRLRAESGGFGVESLRNLDRSGSHLCLQPLERPRNLLGAA